MKLALIPIVLATALYLRFNYSSSTVSPAAAPAVLGASVMESTISLRTVSSFEQKEESVFEDISFETDYKEDDDMEYGEEKVVEEGKKGTKETIYLVTYWFGEETNRLLKETKITEAKTQVVVKGTKVVWRTVETAVGKIKYWRKLHVWATKYDGNCVGCRGLTFSGTLVRKGVCAVDPKVIPLGTNFYVERYGMCRSEDIGGMIKGYHIDLGFEDASKASWGAEWTDVYLMTSAPDGSDNAVNPWKPN